MRGDVLIVALVVGLGTWLFRFLPTRFRGRTNVGSHRIAGAMESIGPAAISTLLVASLLPDLSSGAAERPLILAGCLATAFVFALKRNVVLATLAGAAAYGAAFALLGQ